MRNQLLAAAAAVLLTLGVVSLTAGQDAAGGDVAGTCVSAAAHGVSQ